VPVLDPMLLPAFVPEYPAVLWLEVAPRFLEPSRSLSDVGSSLNVVSVTRAGRGIDSEESTHLLAMFELCGPALVLPLIP
jgi:hypothetical protein